MIREFYAGKTLLLTGCTGFVGKCLLEKVLRSLPEVRKVFVLIRSKKNANAQDRLVKEIMQSSIFDRLRMEIDDFDAYFTSKCVAISGDVEKDGLGLSSQDLGMVLAEANILVGCAANVDFNERLDLQLETNVQGSLRMLDVAKRCSHLDCLVHVSTAYVNANKAGRIAEQLPQGRLREAEALVERVKKMSPEQVVKETPSILGRYPNTYTFSKMITERLLLARRENIPLVILRPTIVGSSMREPVPGWIDSVSAAAALYLAAGTGLVKIIQSKTHTIGDQVPVDLVVNAIIASVPRIAGQNRVDVYHTGSSDLNPVTWEQAQHHWGNYWYHRVPDKKVSRADLVMCYNPIRVHFRWFRKYQLPRLYLQARSVLVGSDQDNLNLKRWNKVIDKANALCEAFYPFVTNEWIFESTNLTRLMTELTPEDLDRFPLDICELNWHRYLLTFQYGLHRFILKEDVGPPSFMENALLPYARSSVRDELDASSPYAIRTDIGWALEVAGDGGNPMIAKNIDDWGHADVAQRVLKSKAVRAAIAEEGESTGQSRHVVQRRAEEIVETMKAQMKLPISLSFGWLVQKIFNRMFEGVLIDPEHIAKVRAAAAKGQVIFMPSHKSYFDFLLLSVLCTIYDLPIPHIASGDDFLNLSIITWLFRTAGAFFMRRSLDGDAVYSSIFGEYCKTLVKDGTPLEFFIEGTRSRSGKMLQPKVGLLSLLINGFLDREASSSTARGNNNSSDVFLVPIAISYDLVPESHGFPGELLGQQKVKESLSGVVGAYHVLMRNYGVVALNFADPISVRSLAQQYAPPVPRGVIATSLVLDPSARDMLIKDVATQVSNALITQAMIPSSSIIASILLLHPSGIPMHELIAEFSWVRQLLYDRNVAVMDNEKPKAAVEHALQFIKDSGCEIRSKPHTRSVSVSPSHAVNMHTDQLIVPLPVLGRLHLAYCRNQMIHVFIPEALVALSLAAAGPKPSVDAVHERWEYLRDLFKSEFIWASPFPPESEFTDTLMLMQRRKYLIIKDKHVEIAGSNPMAITFMQFIQSLFWPFVDTYWAVSMSLFALLSEPSIVGTKLLDRSHRAVHALAAKGTLQFYESCSLDTLRNALTFIQLSGVIQRSSESGEATLSRKGLVSLTPNYNNPMKLTAFAEYLAAFRSPKAQSISSSELMALMLPRSKL